MVGGVEGRGGTTGIFLDAEVARMETAECAGAKLRLFFFFIHASDLLRRIFLVLTSYRKVDLLSLPAGKHS